MTVGALSFSVMVNIGELKIINSPVDAAVSMLNEIVSSPS